MNVLKGIDCKLKIEILLYSVILTIKRNMNCVLGINQKHLIQSLIDIQ